MSCGEAHTLALNDKGQVYAWGLATDGQLGLPGTEECIRVPRLKIVHNKLPFFEKNNMLKSHWLSYSAVTNKAI